MPGDDIERRMVDLARPQIAAELLHDLTRGVAVFIPRLRRFKVARIRQSVRSDRSQVGQAELSTIVLAYVTAQFLIVRVRFYLESQAPGYAHNFARTGLNVTQLCKKADPSLFRHEQHLPIRVIEVPVTHTFVEGIDVYRDPRL